MQGATSEPDSCDAPYPAIPLLVKKFQGAKIEKVVWVYFGGRRVDLPIAARSPKNSRAREWATSLAKSLHHLPKSQSLHRYLRTREITGME
jgi:hypothetical protein